MKSSLHKTTGIKRGKRKKSLGNIIFDVIVGLLVTFSVVVTLYPVLHTVAISFNDAIDAIRGGIYVWPREWTLANYITVLQKDSILTGAKISMLRTIIGIATQLLATSLLAYILSQKEFIFRRHLTVFYVITMYVGGGMIPTFLVYRNLGLMNSFWVYILPGMVSAYNMIVIRTYISGLPEGLQDAARIDGAGYIKTFTHVIAPLCKPVFATIALFIGVGQWNSWFDTMLYNRLNPELTTLQYELTKLLSTVSNMVGSSASQNNMNLNNSVTVVTSESVQAAATVLTCLPIVALYPFMQRYFVTGLTIGGIKE